MPDRLIHNPKCATLNDYPAGECGGRNSLLSSSRLAAENKNGILRVFHNGSDCKRLYSAESHDGGKSEGHPVTQDLEVTVQLQYLEALGPHTLSGLSATPVSSTKKSGPAVQAYTYQSNPVGFSALPKLRISLAYESCHEKRLV